MNALLRRFSVLALFGALALTSSAGLTGCAVDATGALAEDDDDGDTQGDGTFDLTVRGDRFRHQAYEIPGRIPMTSSASGPSVEDPPCEGGCWPEDPGPEDPRCTEEPGCTEAPGCTEEPNEGCEDPREEDPREGEGSTCEGGYHGGHHGCGSGHGHAHEGQGEGEGEGSSCGAGSHHDD